MVSVDMCEHDWPGTGCKECFPKKQESKLILSKDDVKQILYEDHPRYDLVEEGEWVQEHKYQYANIIFQEIETDKYYEMGISRSGSYHTDWYYSFEDEGTEAYEVKKVTKTITVESWETV